MLPAAGPPLPEPTLALELGRTFIAIEGGALTWAAALTGDMPGSGLTLIVAEIADVAEPLDIGFPLIVVFVCCPLLRPLLLLFALFAGETDPLKRVLDDEEALGGGVAVETEVERAMSG